MQYKIYYDNKPEVVTNIEASSSREAAEIFYIKQPPLSFCVVIVSGEDGSKKHFYTTEMQKDSSVPEDTATPMSSDFPAMLGRRYSDAYTEAHAIASIGNIIKGVGIVLGFVILIGGFFFASNTGGGYSRNGDFNGIVAGTGFVLGCLVAIPTYILGILVAAQGQIQLATLDTAVNCSRHLKDDDVARILCNRICPSQERNTKPDDQLPFVHAGL